jgi:hypothetical protein
MINTDILILFFYKIFLLGAPQTVIIVPEHPGRFYPMVIIVPERPGRFYPTVIIVPERPGRFYPRGIDDLHRNSCPV